MATLYARGPPRKRGRRWLGLPVWGSLSRGDNCLVSFHHDTQFTRSHRNTKTRIKSLNEKFERIKNQKKKDREGGKKLGRS